MATLNIGFVQSLEFLKNSWNLPSNFPLLEKVWKMEITSGKWLKVLSLFIFFFKTTTSALEVKCFPFWSNLIQSRPCVCCTPYKKLFSCVFCLYWSTITVSFRRKVSKKPLILDPKICTNPSNSRCSIFGKSRGQWTVYRAFSVTWLCICKFMGTKESVCIRKEINSHRIGLEHKHGRRFIVLEHQYGRRDVMWKRSIIWWLVDIPLTHYVLQGLSTSRMFQLIAF